MRLADPSATYDLPLTSRGVLRIKPRVRETHLAPDADACVTQAVGPSVRVWVACSRTACLVLPVEGWLTTRAYEQSIHRWGVSMGRYLPDDTTGQPGLAVRDDGRSTVEVAVEPVDVEVPVDD